MENLFHLFIYLFECLNIFFDTCILYIIRATEKGAKGAYCLRASKFRGPHKVKNSFLRIELMKRSKSIPKNSETLLKITRNATKNILKCILS